MTMKRVAVILSQRINTQANDVCVVRPSVVQNSGRLELCSLIERRV